MNAQQRGKVRLVRRGRAVATVLTVVLLAVLVPATRAHAAPAVTSFSPASGPVGTSVTVTGSGFVVGSTTVSLGGRTATATSVTTSSLVFSVPSFAATSPITVTVSGSSADSTTPFTVTPGLLVGSVVAPGGSIVVYGSAFGQYQAVEVTLVAGDTRFSVGNASSDGSGSFSATITVPATAPTGAYQLVAKAPSGPSAVRAITVRGDLLQYGGTARHRGTQPFETLLSRSAAAKVDLDWVAKLPFTTTTTATIVANGVLYAAQANDGCGPPKLAAYDATTGASLWSVGVGPGGCSSAGLGLAASGSRIYVTSGMDAKLYAYSTSGALSFTGLCTNCGSSVTFGPVTVANGLVYTVGGDGVIRGFNSSTGAQAFSTVAGGLPAEAAAVAAAPGLLAYIDYQNGVWAFDASSGAVRWHSAPPSNGAYYSSGPHVPVIAAGVVLAPGQGQVVAYKLESGGMLWGSAVAPTAQLASDGAHTVYGESYALRAIDSNGNPLWTIPMYDPGPQPVIAMGVAWAVDYPGNVRAVNVADGTLVYSAATGTTGQVGTLAIANGILYVPQGAYLSAFSSAGATR